MSALFWLRPPAAPILVTGLSPWFVGTAPATSHPRRNGTPIRG